VTADEYVDRYLGYDKAGLHGEIGWADVRAYACEAFRAGQEHAESDGLGNLLAKVYSMGFDDGWGRTYDEDRIRGFYG